MLEPVEQVDAFIAPCDGGLVPADPTQQREVATGFVGSKVGRVVGPILPVEGIDDPKCLEAFAEGLL